MSKLDKWLKEINEHTSSGLLMERDVDLCIQIIEVMKAALENSTCTMKECIGHMCKCSKKALAECERILEGEA